MDDLFDRLQREGEAGIRRLVDERTQETVTLDFKRKRESSKSGFDREDKSTLAELLSGFANSAGGVAIWGVDARKGEDGVDCAQDVVAISGIERFMSEAQGLVGRLVMPRLEGVSLAVVRCDQDRSAGYLLVRVERSERRPHRSEATERKHYFKRSGDSFYAMEHYDIEDAFRRISAPVLDAEVTVRTTGPIREPDQLRWIAEFTISIKNTGQSVARYPYIQIGKTWAVNPNNPAMELGFKSAGVYGVWTTYSGGADNIIHPDQAFPAFHFRADYTKNSTEKFSLAGRSDIGMSLYFEFRVGCEAGAVIERVVDLDAQQIVRLFSASLTRYEDVPFKVRPSGSD